MLVTVVDTLPTTLLTLVTRVLTLLMDAVALATPVSVAPMRVSSEATLPSIAVPSDCTLDTAYCSREVALVLMLLVNSLRKSPIAVSRPAFCMSMRLLALTTALDSAVDAVADAVFT